MKEENQENGAKEGRKAKCVRMGGDEEIAKVGT